MLEVRKTKKPLNGGFYSLRSISFLASEEWGG
jgi:hypothetical protein